MSVRCVRAAWAACVCALLLAAAPRARARARGECDSDGGCTTDTSNEETRSTTSLRISERKCQEYERLTWMDCNTKKVIRGGRTARPGEFANAGAIGWDVDGEYKFECGGALVSPRFVLTAAHCAHQPGLANPRPAIARFGHVDLHPRHRSGDVRISAIHKHPQYRRTRQYHDIALLELARAVASTDRVRPACVWTGAGGRRAARAVAVGWGVTDPVTSRKANELQKVELDLLRNEDCNVTLSYKFNRKWEGFSDEQICAGDVDGVRDTCEGDSGSPLLVPKSECFYYVVGVTAKGNAYCGTGPAVYTRVASYLEWLEGIVWADGL